MLAMSPCPTPPTHILILIQITVTFDPSTSPGMLSLLRVQVWIGWTYMRMTSTLTSTLTSSIVQAIQMLYIFCALKTPPCLKPEPSIIQSTGRESAFWIPALHINSQAP